MKSLVAWRCVEILEKNQDGHDILAYRTLNLDPHQVGMTDRNRLVLLAHSEPCAGHDVGQGHPIPAGEQAYWSPEERLYLCLPCVRKRREHGCF